MLISGAIHPPISTGDLKKKVQVEGTINNNGTVLGPQEFQEDRFLHLVKHSDYGGDHGTATTTTIYYNETTTFNINIY